MKQASIGKSYWDEASAMRKLTDSAVVYLQDMTGKYPAPDLMSKLTGDLMYAKWAGVDSVYVGGKPKLTEKKLDDFMDRMGIPNTEGLELIDTKVACYEDREAIVPVRVTEELRRREMDEKSYHVVTIRNLCDSGDSSSEKLKSLNYVEVDCTCIRTAIQKTCRADYVQRRGKFNDMRKRNHIPSPYAAPVDKHSEIALNYCSLQLGTFNLGISGLTSRTVQIEKEAIAKMNELRIDKRWPMYRINLALKDHGEKLFSPLVDVALLPTREYQLRLLESNLFSCL